MNINNLLIWMSYRGQGSWGQFRSAVERLHIESEYINNNGDNNDESVSSDLPLYQSIRFNLQRLAHVEFISRNNEFYWRIVPPTLATTISNNGSAVGIFCGARSPEMVSNL